MNINEYIDHTLLKATASLSEINRLCEEAMEHYFYAVCVNSCYVYDVKKALEGSDVKIASVIGFPLGAMSTEAKIFEAKECIADGAHEIDMVINLGWVKSEKYDLISDEIRRIKRAIGDRKLKVILEMCSLTDFEKMKVIQLCLESEADFIKTSTGFGSGGATPEDVQLIKELVQDKKEIKASGGIRDYQTAIKYIQWGANRIGTSSGVKMMEEMNQKN